MPAWFVARGYVFAAINFRLAGSPRSPAARISDMAFDIAKAIKWLTVNGRRFGGRNAGFVLMGYSSGAHLAALVATHQRFLQAYRLTSSQICGVIVMDIPYFDVPFSMRIIENEAIKRVLPLATLYQLFSADRSEQAQISPAAQIGPWLNQMAFLIVSVGWQFGRQHTFTQQMRKHFQECLSIQGVQAEHYHLDNWEHVDLVKRWGVN